MQYLIQWTLVRVVLSTNISMIVFANFIVFLCNVMNSVSTRTETCRVMFIYFQIYGLWYLSLLLMYSIKSLMTGISNIENNWLDVF